MMDSNYEFEEMTSRKNLVNWVCVIMCYIDFLFIGELKALANVD